MKYRHVLSLLGGLLFMTLSFWLISCSQTPTTVTPPPTATPTTDDSSSSAPFAWVSPQLTCDDALHLIRQNQIKELLIYRDINVPSFTADIQVLPRDAEQMSKIYTLLPDNNGLDVGLGNLPLNKCEVLVVAAAQQMNKRLSRSLQIVIVRTTTSA